MNKTTILVLSDSDDPQLAMLNELRNTGTVIIGNSPKDWAEHASCAEVLFNWSGALPVLREAFLMCPRLRWMHSRSAGLERTLFPELIASEVTLTNGSGVFSPALGEFALAAILYFSKDFRRMIRNQMAGVWEPFDITLVSGQTVGIVGYGDIGREAAVRVRAMGMNVLAMKRHVRPTEPQDLLAERIYSPDQRMEMFPRCDYLVVALPLTPETYGLIGEAEFAGMKETAVLINVGRGPVIDETVLTKALFERRIRGAALDVFDQEPLPASHPFYKLDNVLLSPHCADHTPDWLDNAVRFFITQFGRFRRGEPLLNIVDKKLGY